MYQRFTFRLWRPQLVSFCRPISTSRAIPGQCDTFLSSSTQKLIEECGVDVRKWDVAFDKHGSNAPLILNSMQHVTSLSVTPSIPMLCTFLRACFVSKNSMQAVDMLSLCDSSLPVKVFEMALHVCRNNNDLISMEKLIHLASSRGVAPWYGYYECLLHVYCNHNNLNRAMDALIALSSNSGVVKPNRKVLTYLAGRLLSLASDANAVKEASLIVAFMERFNIERNSHFYCIYVSLLVKAHKIDEAMELLDNMHERYPAQKSDHAYSAVLTYFARNKNLVAVQEIFDLLRQRKIRISTQVYGIFLQCAASVNNMEKLYDVLDAMMREGLVPDHVTWRVISTLWSQRNELQEMKKFIEHVVSREKYLRDYESYADLLSAMYRDAIGTAGRMNQPDTAHNLLLELQYIHRITPDRSIWLRIIRSFAHAGQYSRVAELLVDMIQLLGSADNKCYAMYLEAVARSSELSPAHMSDAIIEMYSKYKYFPDASIWRRSVHDVCRRLHNPATEEKLRETEAALILCLADWCSTRPAVVDLIQCVAQHHGEDDIVSMISLSGSNSVVERLKRYLVKGKFAKCMRYADDWLMMNTGNPTPDDQKGIKQVLESVFEMCSLSDSEDALQMCRRFISIAGLRGLPLSDTMQQRILEVFIAHGEMDDAMQMVNSALDENHTALTSCAIECIMYSSLYYSQQKSYIDSIVDVMLEKRLFCEAAGRRYVLFYLQKSNVSKCLSFIQRLTADEAPRIWEELVAELAARNMLDECFWAWEESTLMKHQLTTNTYHAIVACCAKNDRVEDALCLLETLHSAHGRIPSDLYLPLLTCEYSVCLQVLQHMEATSTSIYGEHCALLIAAAAKSKQSVMTRVASALRLMEKYHISCVKETFLPVFEYIVLENDTKSCNELLEMLGSNSVNAYSHEVCAILRSKEEFAPYVARLKQISGRIGHK